MITATLFGDMKIKLTDDTPAIAGASWVYRNNAWIPNGSDTLAFVWKKLDSYKDAVVVDGGANAGTFSYVMAKHPNVARVYAFEPAPAVFGVLKKNLELNGVASKVIAQQAALTSVYGPCKFLLAENAAYSHTGDVMLRYHGSRTPLKCETLTVDGVMLDSLLEKEPKISLIKLDLEGGELRALHGAVGLAKRDRPFLLYEYQQENTAQHGYKVEEIEKFLRLYGYRTFNWCGKIDRTAS